MVTIHGFYHIICYKAPLPPAVPASNSKIFGFCTSKQIVPVAKMRNIISNTKK